ncbi:MAG: flagellin lysine-N-methylase [Selenomonadaceae bacterium]|nr:flagellin lysine-N-methylase [Selenomonadaceae bacterium]
MEKKYFYFQPQYVNKFKCDGSKCNAHCCRTGWNIFVDKETYKLYSQDITSHMKFDSEREEYLILFGGKNFCPFLTENKLCRLQMEHGEKFLSLTCATYPRITSNFGYFFERSLILSCPLAAEMILFEREPMKFEFVEVSEKIHSHGGKILVQQIESTEELRAHMIEIQVAMISILQERTLTLDQRLIVLGFFVDRLEEIFSDFDEDALIKLIAAYESKKFLAEQMPLMLQSISFDVEKLIRLIHELFEKTFDEKVSPQEKKILDTIAANYRLLTTDKKKFFEKYSPLLENYLVNKWFQNIYPWRFEGSLAQNFAEFVAEYKLFESIIFFATLKFSSDKKFLLELIGLFVTRFEHAKEYRQRIFDYFKDADEPFTIMESLLEGRQ